MTQTPKKTTRTRSASKAVPAATSPVFRKVPITQLKPAPYNPRVQLKRSDPEFIKLRKSIEQFGVVEPILWNERTGHVVGGHQRLAVLKALKHTHVDVAVVNLPIEREKVLNIALNKISGQWDMPKLSELLEDLEQLENGLADLTGFDEGEMDAMLAEAEAAIEDETATEQDDDEEGEEDADEEKPVKEKTIPATFQLVVDLDDEEHQQEVYHWLIEKGVRVKVVTVNP